jgi:uncharacterized protein YjiS (DUF1127 family)
MLTSVSHVASPAHPQALSWRRLVAGWVRRRATRRALAQFDDRLLHDIGITRAEAARECAQPFWR